MQEDSVDQAFYYHSMLETDIAVVMFDLLRKINHHVATPVSLESRVRAHQSGENHGLDGET